MGTGRAREQDNKRKIRRSDPERRRNEGRRKEGMMGRKEKKIKGRNKGKERRIRRV